MEVKMPDNDTQARVTPGQNPASGEGSPAAGSGQAGQAAPDYEARYKELQAKQAATEKNYANLRQAYQQRDSEIAALRGNQQVGQPQQPTQPQARTSLWTR
jgi:hypothetical protein